jgi:hypothetical protein
MFSPRQVYHPRFTNGRIGSRVRIVGGTSTGELLFLVNTKQHSSIELVRPSGQTMTVMSFNKYIDFISADLSPDLELIHVTQRLPAQKGFTFLSMICDVHNPSICREFRSDQPIFGIFLDLFSAEPPVHQLLHFVGPRLTHLLVSCAKKRITVEKCRGGLHLPSVLHWNFSRETKSLFAFYQSPEGFTLANEFKFANQGSTGRTPQRIQLMETAFLPVELALLPASPVHLPFFRTSNYNLFVTEFDATFCVVQQLYEGSESSSAFSVSTYPQTVTRIIFVPGVPPDLPLNFFGGGPIVVVFVPNNFLCVVDIAQNPPGIWVLPRAFAAMSCAAASTNLPIPNAIIDLDTGDCFDLKVNFAPLDILHSIVTRPAFDAMTHLAARMRKAKLLKHVFHQLNVRGDLAVTVLVLRELFQCFALMPMKFNSPPKTRAIARASSERTLKTLKRRLPSAALAAIAEMDLRFPRADRKSRLRDLRHYVSGIMQNKEARTIDVPLNHALNLFRRQNEGAAFIRKAIDKFCSERNPDRFALLLIELGAQCESHTYKMAQIPGLDEELDRLLLEFASDTIRETLGANHVVDIQCRAPVHRTEIEYWQDKLPKLASGRSDSDSSGCSSSGRRLLGSRSLDSRSESFDASEGGSVDGWMEDATESVADSPE